VTGAGGYLGSHVVRELVAARAEVVAAVKRPRGDPAAIVCDLLDQADVERLILSERPECVVHCAAEVPSHAAGYSDEQAAHRNAAMVRMLAKVAAGFSPLLFASSMTVYGLPAERPWVEGDAGDPQSAYGVGKWESERVLADAGVRALSIRLPGLFGAPRRSGLVYNTVRAMADGQTPVLPPTPVVWAAIHVKDAARSVARAALGVASGAIDPARLTPSAVHVSYAGSYAIDLFVRELAHHYGREVSYSVEHPRVRFDLSRATWLGIAPRGSLLAGAASLVSEEFPE
jgi:nucleoside-diphosphate-sugar epimerase